MRNRFAHPLQRLVAVLFILAINFAVRAGPSPQDKWTVEDVVAKHLASIGSTDDLATVKSLIAIGNCKAVTRTTAVKELVGVGQLGSEGDKVLLALLFNSTSYPFEKAAYNGQNLTVATLPDGKRSFLGNFLVANDAPFKQGLIGGVLSTAWPLLNASSDMPKLSYSGTDKISNRKAHKLKYDPRKGGGLLINLFFDAETFQHVRTEYQYSISARMGARPELSVSQIESRYKVVEEFSDFKAEGKLTLPHTYKLRYTIEERNNTQMLEWTMNLSRFAFNEEIDIQAFSLVQSN